MAILFRNYLASALFQALGTHSAPNPYQSIRALTNACGSTSTDGRGGQIEGEKREYRDVAYLLTPSSNK